METLSLVTPLLFVTEVERLYAQFYFHKGTPPASPARHANLLRFLTHRRGPREYDLLVAHEDEQEFCTFVQILGNGGT